MVLSLSCLFGVPILLLPGCEDCTRELQTERIDRLFAKDSRVSVRRFIVLGHQQGGHWPLVVDDTESARYLTAAFQRSGYLGYVPFRNHGSSYEFHVEWAKDGRSISGETSGATHTARCSQARIVALLGSPQGNGSLLVLSDHLQPAEIGLLPRLRELMGDPVITRVPLQEPMPATAGQSHIQPRPTVPLKKHGQVGCSFVATTAVGHTCAGACRKRLAFGAAVTSTA